MTTCKIPLCKKLLPFASLSLLLAAAPHAWSQSDSEEDDEVFELSPFEVRSSEDDIGYYASNTLAGSRLNTNIEDLASPITVVTKQQMQDTGATSFNEVFLYEANTEGALNYTPIELNRGGLKDNVGGSATNGGVSATATTANRVRGLTAPDFGWNYYPSLARIPADAYNVRSIEINRGPNSILFGLGSPAGIVNQSVGYGVLGDDQTDLQFRVGTDGVRTSASTNQSMLDDRLAVFVAGVYDEKEFSRKPSQDIQRRATIGVTANPWKGGTIKAFFEKYSRDQRLPNYIMPRDGITPWLEAGRPVWDTVNQQIEYLDTGEIVPFNYTYNAEAGDFTGDSVLTNLDSPQYVPGIGFTAYGRSGVIRMQSDGSFDFIQRQANQHFPDFDAMGTTRDAWLAEDPARAAMFSRRLTQSVLPPTPDNFASNWTAPAITDKALYDWTEVNLQATNFGEFNAETYNIEFEQKIIEDLYFTAGWFRQNYKAFEFYPMGQQAPVTVYIDTNKYDIDGSPIPNYLLPYAEDYQQDLVRSGHDRDVVRAMLAYEKDFTKYDGWMKWFGRHRLMGLYQWQEDYDYYNRHRIAFVEPSVDPWVTDDKGENFRYANDTSKIPRNLYYGSTQMRITAGSDTSFGVPGYGGVTDTSIRAYNWETGQFQADPVTLEAVHYDAGNGVGVQHSQIESYAGVLQSFFLDDRIVTTLGIRNDEWKAQANTLGVLGDEPALTTSELYPPSNDYRLANVDKLRERFMPYETIEQTTSTVGIVVKPLSWLHLHYNNSENFSPPPSQAFSIYGNTLPIPSGEGEDYGVSINMFDNKLIARLNFFETKSIAERAGQATTLLDRTARMDTANLRGWAETVVRIRSGEDPSDEDFREASLTDAQIAQVEELTGQPYTWPDFPVASTQTNTAEGFEFELIYNPMQNWNIKFVFAKQETAYDSILPEYEPWIADRMEVWQSASAPDLAGEYETSTPGNTINVENFWTGWGFGEIPNHPNSTEWNQDVATYFDQVVDAIVAEARQLEGAAPYGQREWRANLITNYRFTEGMFENFSVGGAIRTEAKAIVGYHGLVNEEGQYYQTDANRPIYDTDVGADRWDDLTHIDLWFKYDFQLNNGKINASIQLNIRDVFAEEDLVPIYANWDGTVANYRISEPRQIFLTTNLSF